MSKLRIDERHVKKLSDSTKEFLLCMEEDIKKLNDKGEDIFNRYMAFNRLFSFVKSYRTIIEVSSNSFRLGNDLQNPFFHTIEHRSKGWLDLSCTDNPFFINSEEDSQEIDNVDELKEALSEIFKVIVKKRSFQG